MLLWVLVGKMVVAYIRWNQHDCNQNSVEETQTASALDFVPNHLHVVHVVPNHLHVVHVVPNPRHIVHGGNLHLLGVHAWSYTQGPCHHISLDMMTVHHYSCPCDNGLETHDYSYESFVYHSESLNYSTLVYHGHWTIHLLGADHVLDDHNHTLLPDLHPTPNDVHSCHHYSSYEEGVLHENVQAAYYLFLAQHICHLCVHLVVHDQYYTVHWNGHLGEVAVGGQFLVAMVEEGQLAVPVSGLVSGILPVLGAVAPTWQL